MRGRAIVTLLTLAALTAPARAQKPEAFEIGPGATSMSDEEKAIVADPNAGMQHGVILVEEAELDESGTKYSQSSYHLRAKILSSGARDLANVDLDVDPKAGDLVQWWGRTILPDGRLLELKREDLRSQTVALSGGEESSKLKGALPGVEPGCVIDYGYVFHDPWSGHLARWRRIALQRGWPMRLFRYRWIPWQDLASGYLTTRAGGLDVKVGLDGKKIVAVGRNLAPIVEEPLMPPIDTLRASVSFFYFNRSENQYDFWNSEAKKIEQRIETFLKADGRLKAALADAKLDPAQPLASRLSRLREWTASHLRIVKPGLTDGLDALVQDHPEWPKEARRKTAEEVLAAGEGSRVQVDLIFLGLARVAGVEAHLVLATDRTDHLWDKNILTISQLGETLVVVRDPAAASGPPILGEPGLDLPFGTVPWWMAGATALEVTSQGAKDLAVPVSEARQNVTTTTARIAFPGPDAPPTFDWSRSFTGQSGLSDLIVLRGRTLEDRQKKLDALCGSEDGIDVGKAEAPKLDDRGSALAIECRGERVATEGSKDALRIDGPWIGAIPELPHGTRGQPVIFAFPWTESLVLDVAAPPGYKAAEPPAPIAVDGPFGSYALAITKTPEGYHVQRDFALVRPKIDPPAYRGLEKFLSDARAADRRPLVFVPAGSAAPGKPR